MLRSILLLVAGLLLASPAVAQTDTRPSSMVPDPATSNPPMTRTPPSVRTGSGVPGSDLPAINPSYPKRLQDYSNPVYRSQPLVRTPHGRRR
jgi:hypothetical protein